MQIKTHKPMIQQFLLLRDNLMGEDNNNLWVIYLTYCTPHRMYVWNSLWESKENEVNVLKCCTQTIRYSLFGSIYLINWLALIRKLHRDLTASTNQINKISMFLCASPSKCHSQTTAGRIMRKQEFFLLDSGQKVK